MITFRVMKVGNHWYPSIKHDYADQLQLDRKLELLIAKLNHYDNDYFDVFLYEVNNFIPEKGFIEFSDEDLTRYEYTDDDFDLRFTIDGREFKISRDLYTLLEDNFNLELSKTPYKIEIW